MNNEVRKKINVISIIGKVFASFGVIFIIPIISFITTLLIEFDGNWNTMIKNLFLVLLPLMLLLLIWNKKYRKTIGILTILFALIFIINIIYYENYSMKIESLIYLHNKYKFSFSDMKIVETTKSYRGLLGEGSTDRSATIKYNEYPIYVYYKNGWKDDYNQRVKLNLILKTYTNEFKIIRDPKFNEYIDYGHVHPQDVYTNYGYIIYLYSTDENIVDSIIKKLDNYVTTNNSRNIIYSLYVIKDREFYNELISADMTKLNRDKVNGITYAPDLFKAMGYNAKRITFSDNYNKEFFINNGDVTNNEYQNSEYFKYIVFWYTAKRDFAGDNYHHLQVFGINH